MPAKVQKVDQRSIPGPAIDSCLGLIDRSPRCRAAITSLDRVTDGHRGGGFLASIDRLLQEPENL
jgi:hypothetical protein